MNAEEFKRKSMVFLNDDGDSVNFEVSFEIDEKREYLEGWGNFTIRFNDKVITTTFSPFMYETLEEYREKLSKHIAEMNLLQMQIGLYTKALDEGFEKVTKDD